MIFLLLCLATLSFSATAQNKAIIKIIHSDSTMPNLKTNVYRLIGNVHLQHANMQLFCDSLYQYADSNYIEAFGNVHAIQHDPKSVENDTVNLWGDFMTYNANTEKAKVRNNVIMKDPQITLTTDFLDYDAGTQVGNYFNGGTIKDSINTLISDIGIYYVPINETFFKDSVRVYTPDYTMYSDTMKYQTETKIITILGPTTIVGDNRTLYSEDGWYNSLTSHSELYKNNHITYNEYQGQADTIVIDSISQNAILKENLHLVDTANNIIIEGEYGEVWKNNDYAFVTDRALMILVGADSLFIHGDTLSVSKDSIGNNVMKAYYYTKFYSLDMQGRCDSMVFPVADSTVYLYIDPIVWATGNQMTGTTIDMLLKNNQVDRFHLNNKAMIINQIDTVMFNQIKGRKMTGYMRDNELFKVDIEGNGEVLYYTDDQGEIIGLNKTICSNMKIFLKERKVNEIVFLNKPEGNVTPLFMLKPEDRRLKDFNWRIYLRPRNKEDIFMHY